VRPKSEGTTLNMNHIVRDYLIPRFGHEIAEDIKPLDIQRWLKSLHTDKGLAWTTVSKIRGVMLRVYKTGILHELVSKNPCQPVETRSKTDYRAIMLTPGPDTCDPAGPPGTRFTASWCSPVPRPLCGHRSWLRYAGRTQVE
jgi:hypothetical protein